MSQLHKLVLPFTCVDSITVPHSSHVSLQLTTTEAKKVKAFPLTWGLPSTPLIGHLYHGFMLHKHGSMDSIARSDEKFILISSLSKNNDVQKWVQGKTFSARSTESLQF